MQRSSGFSKIVEPIFAVIALFNLLEMSTPLLPLSLFSSISRYFLVYIAFSLVLAICFALLYGVKWIRKSDRVNTTRRHAWMRALIRYWLAYCISFYGFAKVFRTQFAYLYTRADTPVGALNGFQLTWNYFAHSYALALVIAGLQIGGSMLLLWRRTALLGIAILAPVMINIMLINVFYHIDIGAFINSLFYTAALLYLLLLHWKELVALFLPVITERPAIGSVFLRHFLKALAIAVPAIMIIKVVRQNPISPLAGKWRVEHLVYNRDTVKANAWEVNAKAWTTVYIEEHGALALCANPYIYDNQRADLVPFEYDSSLHRLRLTDGSDSLVVTVNGYDGAHMRWDGLYGSDTVMLQLSRVEKLPVEDRY